MKFLSTFKITKGFDTWLKMYKDIEPSLNELGIKILWAGTYADETKNSKQTDNHKSEDNDKASDIKSEKIIKNTFSTCLL